MDIPTKENIMIPTAAMPEAWGGQYSRTELQRACAHLGVEGEVVIQRMLEAPQKGDHTMQDGKHVIRVSSRCVGCPCGEDHVNDAASVNHTILHELGHAKQAEREGHESMARQYATFQVTVGYDWNPYEYEANIIADGLADKFRIAL